jgi:rsbT co-antagonist protein RsbR
MLVLAARSGWQGPYADPLNLILYGMSVGGIVLARLVTDTAQRTAEANARRAEEARVRSEQQAAELAEQAAELKHQNEEQRRLIDLVATLEIPAVALADGVLLAPVVGHLDTRRASGLTDRLLQEVNSSRARLVILDIAGVPTVDTAVAQALLRAVQAVRLLGCEVTITGISSSIAATMITLGINMAGVHTARTPQEALATSLGGDASRRN